VLILGSAVSAPLQLPIAQLSTALAQQDWLAITGDICAAVAVGRLADAVALHVRAKTRSQFCGWSVVLRDAAIPWLAWGPMEAERSEARDLYRCWAAAKADMLAFSVLAQGVSTETEVTTGGHEPASRATLDPRVTMWVAELLDAGHFNATRRRARAGA